MRLVLNEFEPTAFNQSKEALLTLSTEDVETVYLTVELYAKRLKILGCAIKFPSRN